ncbi:hypothetical protein CYMTET_18353 [Cymbomonas tetramitiformis]|uniref:Uncharacterized protein n=1 Tax=Cymbomonas tetramitiformis TaxID=36881 RepID=A0AAE0G8D2_9CHLO|nr:hypothetical protein CYMTET_18353 [Cymbomonas tetramitiformis]
MEVSQEMSVLPVPLEECDTEGNEAAAVQLQVLDEPVLEEVGSRAFWRVMFTPCIVSSMDYFGLGMVIALLPYIVAESQAETYWVGIIITAQYLGVLLGSIGAGVMSDYRGPTFVLKVMVAGDIVFFSLSGMYEKVWFLLVVRFFAGAFTPLTPALAYLTDSCQQFSNPMQARVKGIAAWSASASISFTFGTAFSAFMGVENFHISCFVSGGTALCTFLYLQTLKETSTQMRAETYIAPQGQLNLFRSFAFISLLASQVMVGFLFTGTLSILGLIIEDGYGWPATTFGAIMIIFSISTFLWQMFCVAPILRQVPTPSHALFISYCFLVLLLGTVYLLYPYPVAFVGAMNLVGLAFSINIPIGSILAPQDADKLGVNIRGTAMGYARGAFNLGQTLGPATMVMIYDSEPWAMFGCVSMLCALLAGLIYCGRIANIEKGTTER